MPHSLVYLTITLSFTHTHTHTQGVPPERQKVMVGGVTLQDDEWGKAKPKIKQVLEHLYTMLLVQEILINAHLYNGILVQCVSWKECHSHDDGVGRRAPIGSSPKDKVH